MKNISLILALILGSTTVVFAQDKSDLTGPEYKNYKSWKHESQPTVMLVEANKKQVTGPEFKNRKAWDRTDSEKTYAVIEMGSERSKLTGPAYKNYKPWRNNAE
ncbi:hypothetical protein [Formosa sp. PL04]|uniref:hypothetical protein n=1 Tax=Formosa sp. PL04 TaxID=3081755 RepID=UPI002982433B|nr:hypothetical protein [Formosa sp. PL04]MDW5288966.1 hypothetical protein [Formosa sp. PL04]